MKCLDFHTNFCAPRAWVKSKDFHEIRCFYFKMKLSAIVPSKVVLSLIYNGFWVRNSVTFWLLKALVLKFSTSFSVNIHWFSVYWIMLKKNWNKNKIKRGISKQSIITIITDMLEGPLGLSYFLICSRWSIVPGWCVGKFDIVRFIGAFLNTKSTVFPA